jgi:hypothetical protein
VKKPKTLISLILRMAETLAGTGRECFPGIAVSVKCSWQQPVTPFIHLPTQIKTVDFHIKRGIVFF